MEHSSKIKKLNHLDHITWQQRYKSLAFSWANTRRFLPKETLKF